MNTNHDLNRNTHPNRLVIDRLTVAYQAAADTVVPFEHFSLTVEPGELVLLHGPSGCGKTTLLSAIGGLLTPRAGTITLGGLPITGAAGKRLLRHRRDNVGIVFQAFNLVPSLTAVENVAVPMRVAGASWRAAKQRATELLTQLGLDHRLQHRPAQLSGGQQQRVAIARALVNDPPVILADEPTAHLDHSQIENVRSILRQIADAGRIVVISTHDDRLTEVADRVVRMGAGTPAVAPAAVAGEAAKDELVSA
ncbi:MAG TPA: ABC transporter ATP-binding protein [Ilumatobacter sp.]|nr:ABC transporter ATP-binding protein [Ilumatobacter sp.]